MTSHELHTYNVIAHFLSTFFLFLFICNGIFYTCIIFYFLENFVFTCNLISDRLDPWMIRTRMAISRTRIRGSLGPEATSLSSENRLARSMPWPTVLRLLLSPAQSASVLSCSPLIKCRCLTHHCLHLRFLYWIYYEYFWKNVSLIFKLCSFFE